MGLVKDHVDQMENGPVIRLHATVRISASQLFSSNIFYFNVKLKMIDSTVSLLTERYIH